MGVSVNAGLWTLDWTMDLRFELDLGLIHRSMTTISNTAAQWLTQSQYLLLLMLLELSLIKASLLSKIP